MLTEPYFVDCACLIHGDMYNWSYVDNLYSMLKRHLSFPIRLHVWTESHRQIPHHMIKHDLVEWPGVAGPKKAWWYKMQMFNSKVYSGKLLYLDLDVVITDNLDWIPSLDERYFWCARDFKYLWRPNWTGINSSVMYWDTHRFRKVWKNFRFDTLPDIMKKYPGDQDYITAAIAQADRKFMDQSYIQSWRWQVHDGGLNMSTRKNNRPGAGAVLAPNTKIVVFHGNPKPHEITDKFVKQHWC